MSDIKSWAAAVCAAAIAGSLAHLMSPPGNMQKIYKLVVSTFFICAMLMPLLSAGKEISQALPELPQAREESGAGMQSALQDQTAELFAAEIRRLTARKLEEMEVSYVEISVDIHESGDGGIYIEQLDILLPPEEEERGGEILWEIKNYLGVAPKLIRQEGSEQ